MYSFEVSCFVANCGLDADEIDRPFVSNAVAQRGKSGAGAHSALKPVEQPRAGLSICNGQFARVHHIWPGYAWTSSVAGSQDGE